MRTKHKYSVGDRVDIGDGLLWEIDRRTVSKNGLPEYVVKNFDPFKQRKFTLSAGPNVLMTYYYENKHYFKLIKETDIVSMEMPPEMARVLAKHNMSGKKKRTRW